MAIGGLVVLASTLLVTVYEEHYVPRARAAAAASLKGPAMTMQFDGRHAFITGGARGIGYAIAGAFGREGAALTIVDCHAENLDLAVRVAARHRRRGSWTPRRGDRSGRRDGGGG